jgi:beta-lactamase superfamily II metal-dependent hydrolase
LVPGGQAVRRRRSRTSWQALGASSIRKLAETVIAEDAALANGTSISLLIEYCGKRMLLCGDAHPRGLVEGVRRIQPTGRLNVEILKLPHHGSSGNVTDSLLTALRPNTVVFSSSGAIYGHPDEIAVARVLKAYRQFGVHLVFNYETKFNLRWQSKKLQDEWNYTAEYGPKESGVSIFVPITGKKRKA